MKNVIVFFICIFAVNISAQNIQPTKGKYQSNGTELVKVGYDSLELITRYKLVEFNAIGENIYQGRQIFLKPVKSTTGFATFKRVYIRKSKKTGYYTLVTL